MMQRWQSWLRGRRRQHGQSIVMLAISVSVLILGAGLVVDVGFAWSEQRNTQNSADSAARAGAVVLAQRAAEGSKSTRTASDWDEAVRNAVFTTASQNHVTIADAEYTDWQGNSTAVKVGTGTLPATAAGVHATAQKSVQTYLVRSVGISNWNVVQQATAVSGPINGCFDTVNGCKNLPVTFPVTVFGCTNSHGTLPAIPPQTWAFGQELTLPLCGGNPGSVGWIDWTPTAGGTSELTTVILTPPDHAIPLPSWQYITATGDISALQVENALNTYAGQIVQVPIFDSTCNQTPTNPELSGCPAGATGGNGSNQWYHITKFLSFRFDSPKGAFVNGNNTAACSAAANANECLKGAFVSEITQGEVVAPCDGDCPPETQFGVQLVR